MRFLLAAILALVLAAPVAAQTEALSIHRVFWVAEAGAQTYDASAQEVIGGAGFYTGIGAGYSFGPKLSSGIIGHNEWSNSAHDLMLAARWRITSAENAGRMRLFLGVNGVYYYGEGYKRLGVATDTFGESLSWNAGIYGSLHLVGISYLKLGVDYDPDNSFAHIRASLALTDLL